MWEYVATARYFYGSLLPRALKSKIIVILTCTQHDNVDLIIVWKFYEIGKKNLAIIEWYEEDFWISTIFVDKNKIKKST